MVCVCVETNVHDTIKWRPNTHTHAGEPNEYVYAWFSCLIENNCIEWGQRRGVKFDVATCDSSTVILQPAFFYYSARSLPVTGRINLIISSGACIPKLLREIQRNRNCECKIVLTSPTEDTKLRVRARATPRARKMVWERGWMLKRKCEYYDEKRWVDGKKMTKFTSKPTASRQKKATKKKLHRNIYKYSYVMMRWEVSDKALCLFVQLEHTQKKTHEKSKDHIHAIHFTYGKHTHTHKISGWFLVDFYCYWSIIWAKVYV